MFQNKLFSFLIRVNLFIFVLLFLIISYLSIIITFLFPQGSNINDSVLMLNNVYERFFVVVILGPFVETIIFQYLVINGICYFIVRPRFNFYTSISLSALLFSLTHAYNFYYILYTFITGLILAFAYYLARYRKQNAILLIFFIHAIWNLSWFVIDAL